MRGEFSPEEKELVKTLESTELPEGMVTWLDKSGPRPSQDSLNRVKAATMAKIKTDKRESFRRFIGVRTAAAVLVLVLVTTLAIGPQKVLAGLENLLRYVPGFGVQNIKGQTFLATTRPVIVQSGNKRLEVLGLFCDGKDTGLHIKAANVWNDIKPEDFRAKPYLVDEHGEKYTDWGYSLSRGGNGPVEGYFSYGPLRRNPDYVKLIIPGHEDLTARLPLKGPDSLPQLSELGTSDAAKGIVISAMPELRDNGMVVNLVFNENAFKVEGLGSYPAKDTLPVLKDSQGKQYQVVKNNTSNLHFAIHEPKIEEIESTGMTLTIPTLMVKEKGEAEAKVPVPDGGQVVTLGKKVDLGRYELKVTKVQKVADHLRVYVSPGKNDFGILTRFDLAAKGGGLSWHSKHDEQLGQMQYFEVKLADISGKDTVTFVFQNPRVRVDGPWELKFNKAMNFTSVEERN
ncbi:MAG: hypothetical protein FH756_16915 [Firmicutes bacterium]|nr:hypothetical protein [Bacillota bacterium]